MTSEYYIVKKIKGKVTGPVLPQRGAEE